MALQIFHVLSLTLRTITELLKHHFSRDKTICGYLWTNGKTWCINSYVMGANPKNWSWLYVLLYDRCHYRGQDKSVIC